MRIPAKTMRIPAVLALLCCEIASILIMRGQPNFRVFLPGSLAVILLILPLFWIQEIWRQNISYFVIAFSALGIALFIAELLITRKLTDAPLNLFFISLLILGLIRKDRKDSKSFTEEKYEIRKAEDLRFFWVLVNLAGMVSCLIYRAYHPDGRCASMTLPIASLFLCGVVYCLFIKQTQTSSNIDSSRDKVGSGVRP